MPTLTTAQIAEHAARLLAGRRQLAERYLAAATADSGSAKNCDRASVLDQVSETTSTTARALAGLCYFEGRDATAAHLIEADIDATAKAIGYAASECRILALPPTSQANVREAMGRAQAQTQPAQVPA